MALFHYVERSWRCCQSRALFCADRARWHLHSSPGACRGSGVNRWACVQFPSIKAVCVSPRERNGAWAQVKFEVRRSQRSRVEPIKLKRELFGLSGTAVLIVAGLAFAGRLSPWISPDTPSYFKLGSLPGALGLSRNPLYPWLVGWRPGGFAAIPAVQIVLYMLSVVLLHRALRIYGVSSAAASAVSAGLLLSNVVLLWSNAIHPEFPAVALALLSLAQVLLLAAGHSFLGNGVGLALSLGLSYILRPTFLPAIVLLPLLHLALRRLRGAGQVWQPLPGSYWPAPFHSSPCPAFVWRQCWISTSSRSVASRCPAWRG